MRSHSPRRRGGTGTKVLLVLSAIFLLIGAIGGYFLRDGLANSLIPLGEKYFKDIDQSTLIEHVVSPGEKAIEFPAAGGMAIFATDTFTIDEKDYSFAPGGDVDLVLKSSTGATVKIDRAQRVEPFRFNKYSVYLLGFAEITEAGTYTLSTDGQETVLHTLTLAGEDWKIFTTGLQRTIWGLVGTCCGLPLFLVFGIIGGIMMIFGRKPAPMP